MEPQVGILSPNFSHVQITLIIYTVQNTVCFYTRHTEKFEE